MTLLYRDDAVQVWHADWRALLDVVRAEGGCDCLCVDAPYSERTHAGYNSRADAAIRRSLNYESWSHEDVRAFVDAWEPLVRGWFVSITDDVLFPLWRASLESRGRQTFQSVPCVVIGMSIRQRGDGPSSWATYAAVARPRTRAMASWGTLPGAYVGTHERMPVVGGKPLWLMRALVRDYTRPGDLVVDPCCGGGTTLLAARLAGRRAIGGDAMLEHAELAAERLRPLPTQERHGTLPLFGSEARR